MSPYDFAYAASLLFAGVVLADEHDAVGAIGSVALALGIRLAVALVCLALGHNPLSKR